MKIAAIILSLLAISGAGFSVFAFITTQNNMNQLAQGVGQAVDLDQTTIQSFKGKEISAVTSAVSQKYSEMKDAKQDAEQDAQRTKNLLESAQSELDKVRKDALKQREQFVQTRRELSELQQLKADQETQIDELESEVRKLEEEIVRVTNENQGIPEDMYEQEVAAKEALEDRITEMKDQILALEDDIERLSTQGVDKAESEMVILADNTPILEIAPEVGLIVIGAGNNIELQPNSVVTLRKEGRRVARLRVISVQGSMSVANILPGFGYPESLRAQDKVQVLQ